MEQIELFREHEVVVKANDLVRARANWTALEHRIFAMMVAQLRKEDTQFEPQKIHVQDVKELSETKSENLYGRLTEVCDRLPMAVLGVRDHVDGARRYRTVSPISMCEYVEGKGYILAKFNDDLQDLLLQLTGNFTMYRLKMYMQLESMYSMRIYELAMMRADIHHYRIEVDELRAILSCEHKYTRFSDFKRRTLEQARKEINEKTDIAFQYKVERKGRTATHVHFQITDQAEEKHRKMREAFAEKSVGETKEAVKSDVAGDASSAEKTSSPPIIDVRGLVVDELTSTERKNLSIEAIDAAVKEGLRHAQEQGSTGSQSSRALCAYKHAVQVLREGLSVDA